MLKKEKCVFGYSSCCVCVFVLKTDYSRLDCVLIQSAFNQVDQLSGIHKVKKICVYFDIWKPFTWKPLLQLYNSFPNEVSDSLLGAGGFMIDWDCRNVTFLTESFLFAVKTCSWADDHNEKRIKIFERRCFSFNFHIILCLWPLPSTAPHWQWTKLTLEWIHLHLNETCPTSWEPCQKTRWALKNQI